MKFYPSVDNYKQALLVTNITSDPMLLKMIMKLINGDVNNNDAGDKDNNDNDNENVNEDDDDDDNDNDDDDDIEVAHSMRRPNCQLRELLCS